MRIRLVSASMTLYSVFYGIFYVWDRIISYDHLDFTHAVEQKPLQHLQFQFEVLAHQNEQI